jgi:hypothetical protein
MTTAATVNELTWPIEVCFAFQLGAMVRSHRFRTPTALHILSFAGTPTNKARLAKTGFVPLEAYLPGTQIQVMERIDQVGTTAALLSPPLLVLTAVSAMAPDVPPMEESALSRRLT